jgi:hypothetical protein
LSNWGSARHTTNKNFFNLNSKLLVPTKIASRIPDYKVKYILHPWLAEALNDDHQWVANRDRVKLMVHKDGKFYRLEKSDPNRFEKGDVIWTSFAVTFSVRLNNWTIDLIPGEMIRVGHIPTETQGPGTGIDIDWIMTEEDEEPEKNLGSKRKSRASDDIENTRNVRHRLDLDAAGEDIEMSPIDDEKDALQEATQVNTDEGKAETENPEAAPVHEVEGRAKRSQRKK